MKKIFGFTSIMLFAATMLFTGCKSEKEQIFVLEAEQFTGLDKTNISGRNTVWAQGDPIWINDHQATVNTNRTVTISDPVTSINRKFYSMYGGRGIVNSFDGDNLAYSYTMPTSYSYSANELKAPMAGYCEYDASSTTQTIQYTNICTMLKLEFVVIPTEVTITSTSTAIAGNFTVTYDDGNWTVTSPAPTADNRTITISNPNYADVMYVPLPAGTHKLTITGKTFTRAMTSSQHMLKSTLYPIKCAHKFSVSGSKEVFFSPGNYQYYNNSTYTGISNGSTGNTLYGKYFESNDQVRFATNQWDRIYLNNLEMRNGTVVTTGKCRNNAWIDLFGWGTGRIPGYCYATTRGGSGILAYDIFYDWGNHYSYSSTILNNASHCTGTWYTLNREEWSYLLNLTSNSKRSGKCRISTVNSVSGLLIAPDDFTGSLPSSATAEVFTENYQKKGVVFLPNGGYMHHRETIADSWGFSGQESMGGYWTSSENVGGTVLNPLNRGYFVKLTTSSYSITEEDIQDNPLWNRNKPCKLSVRLVQNAN